MEPALSMLLERLLWPIPRVRWEVARSLARLIREGDREVAEALVNWISARQFESEAVLGLGVIEAFDLGAYFEFAEVSEAVRAPSYLSDFILKENFADARGLSPFRYEVSPSEPAALPPEMDSWFDRYRKWAVAPIFSDELERLEETTGFPFLRQWNHEWCWLQATHQRPSADYPFYFSGGDRRRRGQFDHGQRELYVSAYLRTLAYAALRGLLSHADAERHALLGLPMNRGLGDLQPVARPDWGHNLLLRASGSVSELAWELWDHAVAFSRPDETPIALRINDVDKTDFIEFEMTMTIGPRGYSEETAVAEQSHGIIVNENPGRMMGEVGRCEGTNTAAIRCSLPLSQWFVPEYVGRAHVGMAREIRLASPYVFGTVANILCEGSEIRLETASEVFSRWVHWYSDWEPATFAELGSPVGSVTTVSTSSLDRLRMLVGTEFKRWATVRRTVRSEPYRDYEVETEVFCA